MIYPIFIPSKGRPNGKTFKILKAENIHSRIVLEPNDIEAYKANHGGEASYCSLHERDNGIAFARNFILKTAQSEGIEWFWSLDDDIDGFTETGLDGKPKKIAAREALEKAQDIITAVKAAQGAISYSQFTLNKKKPYRMNRRCLIATLNHVPSLEGVWYDPKCTLKEDIDFSLQIMTSGRKTVLCEQLGFRVPVYGTTKGGCHSLYQLPNIEKQMSQYLMEKWGRGLVTAYLKDSNRYDVKINWKKFD